jgi:hypothetical protein
MLGAGACWQGGVSPKIFVYCILVYYILVCYIEA